MIDKVNQTGQDFSRAAIEHVDALFGFAMVLTRDRTEAEDLVQETYLRAARAFGRLLPDSNLKSWMFAIMRNIWLNQVRHERAGPRFVELDSQEDVRVQWVDHTSIDPHAMFVRKVEKEQLRLAIEKLPAHYREVILLRDIEEFSYQQIASILECPAGTVMSRLSRAREHLKSMLYIWRSS